MASVAMIVLLVVFVCALVWFFADTVVKVYAFRVEQEQRRCELDELARELGAADRRRRLTVVRDPEEAA